MKPFAFLSVFVFFGSAIYAQHADSLNSRQITDHRLTENNVGRERRGTYRPSVPAHMIILNYTKVISMTEYQKVKGNGDIIKEYVITRKFPEAAEVESVRIVESKNKDKYKDFGIKE